MSALDWVGLWAALQVIGIVIGVVGSVIYVVGGTLLDEWRRRR